MVTHVLRRGRKASWFVVALLTSSCADLQDIPLGVCGNNVVDEGEDCEGPQDTERLCAKAGAEHECRFIWSDVAHCPEGMAYGADQRCRAPSGSFAESTFFELPGNRLFTTDLEGDGSLEVASIVQAADGPALSLSNVSAAGAFSLGAPLPSSGYVGIGELSGDERPDVALSIRDGADNGGLTVLVNRDGALDLKLFPEPAFVQELRFITLAPWLYPDETESKDYDLEVLARVTRDNGKVSVCPVDFGCRPEDTFTLKGFAFEDVVVVHDRASQLVWSTGRESFLYLPRELVQAPFSGAIDPSNAPLLELESSGPNKATPLTGPSLVDINGDGLNDVVALGLRSSAVGMYVLLGEPPELGENFPRWEGNPMAPGGADRLSRWLSDEDNILKNTPTTSRLITAQVNSDGLPDFILDGLLLLSKQELHQGDRLQDAFRVVYLDNVLESVPTLTGAPVAVGDVNGDGLDDVVRAFSPNTARLSFGGDLLPLTEVDLQLNRPVSALAISDFDGDGAGDVLMGVPVAATLDSPEQPDQAGACIPDELMIAYGSKLGLPESPSSIGVVRPVIQFVSGRFWSTEDGYGDFAVASQCNDGSSFENVVLYGNAFRIEATPTALTVPLEGKPEPLDPQHMFFADVVSAGSTQADFHNDLIVVGNLGTQGTHVAVYASTGEADISFKDPHAFALPQTVEGKLTSIPPEADLDLVGSSNLVVVGLAFLESSGGDGSMTQQISGQLIAQDLAAPANLAASLELPPLTLAEGETVARPFARLVGFGHDENGTPSGYMFVYGAELEGQVEPSVELGGPEVGIRGTVRSRAMLLHRAGSAFEQEELGFDVTDVVVADTLNTGTTGNLYMIDNFGSVIQPGLENPLVGVASLQATEATAGDFNGDGLIDLLVSDGTTGSLLYQLPLNP